MSGLAFPVFTTAAQLRRAFDHSFTVARSFETPRLHDFLSIRLGTEPYAMRLEQVARLVAGITITPLPTTAPHLLGIAGSRGAIVPVYDLRSLLGCSTADVPRWIVLVATTLLPVALAFDVFEGHLRVPGDAIALGPTETSSWQQTPDVLHAPDHLRPIVNVPAIIDWISLSMLQGLSPSPMEQ
ncbi:MAG TPA: chemotaxis protein CheW [Gemmatimonadaceae bacterium]|jgi:purine-binding chemotaxis protein CheW|nr:chemotaxis protein CheW [Gemmatimonadaceae bacterium]